MSAGKSLVSSAFQTFLSEAPQQAQAWGALVQAAKAAKASREEVISAILVGPPAAGHAVTQSLPLAVETYDAE